MMPHVCSFARAGLGLLALVSIGFALRVWGIERYGLWIDEITTAQCLALPLLRVLDCYWVQVGSPIVFVATNLVYTLFGRMPLPAPEWMVRLPEVIAGTLTIPAAWLAAREWFGTRGAWLNAWLWTLAPTAIAYSQEARMYAWLMLFSNLSTWLLLRALRRGAWRGGIEFGVVAALNFYSHYLGAFVLAGQWLFASAYVLYAKRRAAPNVRRVFGAVMCAAVTFVALLLLWLPNIWKAAQTYFLPGAYTRLALTPASFADAETWLVLNNTAMPFAAFALTALTALGAWWMMRHARAAFALVACWLAIPLGFLFIRQADWTAMRYWLVIQPALYGLLTAGVLALVAAGEKFWTRRKFRFEPRAASALVAVASTVLLAPSLAQFYLDPYESWRFDDWRGAAQTLRAQAGDHDLILAFGDAAVYHVMALDYYLGARRAIEAKSVDGDTVARAEKNLGRAWGITYVRNAQALETLRAHATPEFDMILFKNLALLVPKRTQQETVRASAARLAAQFRALDETLLTPALALLGENAQGENVLQNTALDAAPDGAPYAWHFDAVRAQVVEQGGTRALKLSRQEDSRAVTTAQSVTLLPAHTYVLRFECRRALTRGTQRTYVRFDGADGKPIVFPQEGGYVCPRGSAWHAAAFAFRVPSLAQAAPTAQIILRNAGIGDALWRKLTLNESLLQ